MLDIPADDFQENAPASLLLSTGQNLQSELSVLV